MKTFKNYINEINGLRFIYENLKLNSSIGRKFLLNQKFITDETILNNEFNNLSAIYNIVNTHPDIVKKICSILENINDIHSSINNLSKEHILDDIELFEIKKFSILCQKIINELSIINFDALTLHDLKDVINILDPENTGIPSFYIYSIYDSQLAELRKKQKEVKKNDLESSEKLRLKSEEIEDKIRKKLSYELSKYAIYLQTNLNNLSYLDVLIAKSIQANEFNLCKPSFSIHEIEYQKLFNPQVKCILNSQSKTFQPIDIKLVNQPVLITGANMSGKTVLLKTIALSQYMFQFGFFIPAGSAKISIFDEIMLNIGDSQSELNGLSSFAVEMLNINNIISEIKKTKKLLVIIDELARTTNPYEGKAIVSAFIEIMSKYNTTSIITTHYSIEDIYTRRLRVKGLTNINIEDKITVNNINDFMDYSLEEVFEENVPTEALKIAEILGLDEELVNNAKNKIHKL